MRGVTCFSVSPPDFVQQHVGELEHRRLDGQEPEPLEAAADRIEHAVERDLLRRQELDTPGGVHGTTGVAGRLPCGVFACRHAPLVLSPDIERTLAAAYAEPQRAYHTATHIAELLRWFVIVHDEVGWHAPAAVYLAILFHDAVYDPTRHDNEARSAALAVTLAGAGPETTQLIALTAQHGKLDHADHDAAHFLDSDTAILGAAPAEFDAYDAAIAFEYKHVPPDTYRAGRCAFLQSMLARERIFFSAFFHARLDARARTNLTRALGRL